MNLNRRELLQRSGAGFTALAGARVGLGDLLQAPAMITRRIPSSGKIIPVIGLGTWQTFDVGASDNARVAGANPHDVRAVRRQSDRLFPDVWIVRGGGGRSLGEDGPEPATPQIVDQVDPLLPEPLLPEPLLPECSAGDLVLAIRKQSATASNAAARA
jgi:hypothetical protein